MTPLRGPTGRRTVCPVVRWHEKGRHRAYALVACALWLGAGSSPAAAEVAFGVHGQARFRAIAMSDFALDDQGTTHGQRRWGTMLLRLAPEVRFTDELYAKAELQILDGQLFGDDSDVGGEAVIRPWRETHVLSQLALREAYIQIPVFIGVLRAGRMASDWGLGMLANSGGRDDYPFADATHGDIVNRAAFITRPLEPLDLGLVGDALHLVLAADLVERDELTDRDAGDLAWQAVGAVLWRQRGLDAGLYVAHRELERDNGAEIKATAIDLFARWQPTFGDRFELDLGFEGALIVGETNELEFEGEPEILDVLQMGFVARAALVDRSWCLEYGLELGFASGDNDTQDGTLRAFRFDPAYKVGMILYEEILGRMTAHGADRAADPDLSGTPPKGIERAPTNGSVTNTAYLFPRVAWSPLDGMVTAQLGLLLAFSAGDLVDPFASATQGGYNTSAYGKANAHGVLGAEIDLGGAVRIVEAEFLSFRLGAQYGVFLEGPALSGIPGVGTVHKLRLVSDVRW